MPLNQCIILRKQTIQTTHLVECNTHIDAIYSTFCDPAKGDSDGVYMVSVFFYKQVVPKAQQEVGDGMNIHPMMHRSKFQNLIALYIASH